MSSTSPSVAATVTALLALTTPFVAPPGCPRFTTTSIHDTSSIDGVAAVLVADDPSCHPEYRYPRVLHALGWANIVPKSRMNFSPGVCPSGWVYYHIRTADDPDNTLAACCDSGYTLLDFEHSELVTSHISNGCGKWTTRLDDDAGSNNATITDSSSTLLVHRVWTITWHASDTPSLTPRPPSITSGMWVPTWTPGEVIPDGKYDHSENGDNVNYFLPASLYLFVAIGIPLISASLIGSCVFCCVRSCRKKKRAQRAASAAEGVPGGK